jgi:beta-xylosidase
MPLPRLSSLLAFFCAITAFAADGGYLFVTFNGERTPLTEQIYFGLSPDGRNWEALNAANPVLVSQLGEKGVRDPFIIRSPDGKKAYLIATDLSINLNPVWKRAATAGSHSIMIWESADLVHWSEPRLVKISPDDAGCTWAPEATYDAATGDYLVYWSSANGRDNFAKFRVWAARTKDFKTFGEPFIYIERDYPVIDTTIVRENGRYYRFTKREDTRMIFLETSDHLAGPWTEMPDFSLAASEGYEGPACYQIAPAAAGQTATWCLLLDNFTKGAGYKAFVTHDLAGGKFEPAADIKFPFRFRHGTVLPVTAEEYARLKSAYPGAPAGAVSFRPTGNPLFTDAFTADPAALVYKDTLYVYTGQDEAPTDRHQGYVMNRWLCYSTKDMVNWTAHGSPFKPTDFAWAKGDAWAGQVIERGGKFWWYAPVKHATIPGMSIGVGVADSPTGPFKDARGSALVTNDMTTEVKITWDDIDPTVWIDDDGQAWLFWGNQRCYFAKLKANMTEFDGPIQTIPSDQLVNYTEAPWIHKHGNLYYLSYASGFPEKMAYSTATKITGPWTPRGLLSEGAFNSNTIHQAIVTFKGRDYFFYHNGGRQAPDTGSSFRRSVCVDYLYYNPDGTIKRVIQTTEGVSVSPQK